jgi:hypothetical protein
MLNKLISISKNETDKNSRIKQFQAAFMLAGYSLSDLLDRISVMKQVLERNYTCNYIPVIDFMNFLITTADLTLRNFDDDLFTELILDLDSK